MGVIMKFGGKPANGTASEQQAEPPEINTAPLFDVLWTNPDGSETFATQDISIDLSNYAYVIIFYRTTSNYSNALSLVLRKNTYGYLQSFYNLTAANAYLNQRSVNATGSVVHFGDNTRKATNNTTAGATNNAYNIPVAIHGIRNLNGVIL